MLETELKTQYSPLYFPHPYPQLWLVTVSYLLKTIVKALTYINRDRSFFPNLAAQLLLLIGALLYREDHWLLSMLLFKIT